MEKPISPYSPQSSPPPSSKGSPTTSLLNRSMSVATSATSRTSNISSLPSINSATSPPKVKGSLLQKNKRGQEKIPSGDPRRFCAFVVSIQKYKHINSLEECVSNDGVDLHQILTNHAIGQYSIDNFVHAINPSKNQLLKQLKQFTKRCRKVRKNTLICSNGWK